MSSTARQTLVIMVALSACYLPFRPARAQSTHAAKPFGPDDKSPDSLSRQVHHQLRLLPFYSVFDNLSFSIAGNRVTLSGQVLRQTLKENAEAAVKEIEGVGPVVNNIEVLPASATDDELRREVYRAIFEDAVLAKYAIQPVPTIHIVVKKGVVTLEGTVDVDADKLQAGKHAGSVPNVTEIRNNLVLRKRDTTGQ
jgi:hyperosmotically inducible periplasmic protein